MMKGCVFCKIAKKKIPAEIIYEDSGTLVFLDINPVSKGHTLFVPKEHFKDFLSAPDESICKTLSVAKKIAPIILKAVGATGFNLTANNGSYAGQSISHLHFHLIHRGKDFPKPKWPTIEYKESEIEKVASKIKMSS